MVAYNGKYCRWQGIEKRPARTKVKLITEVEMIGKSQIELLPLELKHNSEQTADVIPSCPAIGNTTVMGSTGINKTIVITYDDATRMIDFCKNAEKEVSKDFYDWYLKEGGEYFAKTGMLIIDGMIGEKERVALSFDFTNPDAVEFNVYRYKDQKIISSFFFYRQDNLTMKDVSVDIKYFSSHFFKGQKNLWLSPEVKERVLSLTRKIAANEAQRRKTGQRATKMDLVIEGSMNSAFKDINLFNCKALVYFTYALMYSVSKQEPEEITTDFQRELENETGGIKVKSVYKYTGYIDLRENKVYKPIVKKDPDEPVREYQRHIQKWSVRGHYRKTKNGLIWIEPHLKGEGELEKRIYGTEDEKDLHLIPKVFEVERTVKEKSEIKVDFPEQKKEEIKPVEVVKDAPVIVKQKKVSIFRKLLKLFGW